MDFKDRKKLLDEIEEFLDVSSDEEDRGKHNIFACDELFSDKVDVM